MNPVFFRLTWITLLLLFCDGLTAQENLIINVRNRQNVSLNGRWNYVIDPYETGFYNYRRRPFDETGNKRGGFYADRKQQKKSELIEYDFDFSPAMTIPGDWNSQDSKLEFYEGSIWFRRKFDANIKLGIRYFIYFGATNYEAHVYLNSEKLGIHIGGFTPYNFEVTDLLKKGANSLVLKVDNTRRPEAIPTVNTDWWNYGGITRDVFLVETPSTFIRDYKIQLAKGSTNLIKGYVRLDGAQKQQIITISIPNAGVRQNLKTHADGLVSFEISAKALKLWSPESPFLYNVIISTESDTITEEIGFRNIETKGKKIFLNGKSIYLRGICSHEENPLASKRAFSLADARVLLNWAKDLNCNFVRLAHYPHNEYMVRLAEKMGIMVWSEIPVYWTIQWENPETYQNAKNQFTELVTRDKNRANVIVWSIGNETPLSDARHKFMGNLVDYVRRLDDTRLMSAALEVHTDPSDPYKYIINDPLGKKLDLLAFNEYVGWYDGTPDKCSKILWEFAYDKPVHISETGAGALQGYHADSGTRWSEEYQAELYKQQLEMIEKQPQIKGFSPWILVDFRSPRRPHPVFQQYWNRKGVISNSGTKKQAFFILKDYYDKIEQEYK